MKQQVRKERSYKSESDSRTISDSAKCPRKRGKAELGKHLQGKKIAPRGAMRAKCYECMGFYVDGAVDCGIPTCPLYPFMPYRFKDGLDG